MEQRQLAAALADPQRLRLFAAVALGAATDEQARATAGVDAPTARAGLRRLIASGVVRRDEGGLSVDLLALRAQQEVGPQQPGDGPDLRPFLVGDELRSLPTSHGRRGPILRHVANRTFDAGQVYDEAAVNDRLRRWTGRGDVDHVALRRYLVDAGLLARNHSSYWLVTEDRPPDPDVATQRVEALGLR